jgi:crotonobetainyl-CoA:carnitine CoA-transferase CaiB-like acyl-CoA transferase
MSISGPAEAAQGALTGIRVIELATMLSAPLAGTLLADHGAEVIKIELPGLGDPLRKVGLQKRGVALTWSILARNKRLITLDVRTPRGRDLLLRLVERSNGLIENFRPGTMEAWGLAPDNLRSVRADLVVLRVSGFGQTGPKASRAGFGTLAEAMSGFAYINGWPDKPPALPPFGLADSLCGFIGAFGMLAAMRAAHESGLGQDVDLALYEPLMTALGSPIIEYDQLGVVQERTGNRVPSTAPRNAYPTADTKWVVLSGATQNVFARLMDAIGHSDLVQDPRFSDNRQRVINSADLDEYIQQWISERTLAEVLSQLEFHGVPAGPIYSSADLLADPHMAERGSIVAVEDPQLGPVRMQAPIPIMSSTPARIRFTGGPLGCDNEAIFTELLGLSAGELSSLRAEHVV